MSFETRSFKHQPPAKKTLKDALLGAAFLAATSLFSSEASAQSVERERVINNGAEMHRAATAAEEHLRSSDLLDTEVLPAGASERFGSSETTVSSTGEKVQATTESAFHPTVTTTPDNNPFYHGILNAWGSEQGPRMLYLTFQTNYVGLVKEQDNTYAGPPLPRRHSEMHEGSSRFLEFTRINYHRYQPPSSAHQFGESAPHHFRIVTTADNIDRALTQAFEQLIHTELGARPGADSVRSERETIQYTGPRAPASNAPSSILLGRYYSGARIEQFHMTTQIGPVEETVTIEGDFIPAQRMTFRMQDGSTMTTTLNPRPPAAPRVEPVDTHTNRHHHRPHHGF